MSIHIQGANQHNLKNVDLEIPDQAFTVITGVSGSGKSSLAFDTLFAEGQRQFIESLSAYARRFLDQMQRPAVQRIDGLQPTLCIDQKGGSHNRRSTVATITEVYDYLRLLYARIGIPHCPACSTEIRQQDPQRILEQLMVLPEGRRIMLLAPMIRGRKGKHAEVFEQIRQAGFVRARVDGELYPLEEVPELNGRKIHTIEAVIDRLVARGDEPDYIERLSDSLQIALRTGKGLVSVLTQNRGDSQWDERLFSTQYSCPNCGHAIEELEPRTFSFNSPYGACGQCDGMGTIESRKKVKTCPSCEGGRLKPESLMVTIQNMAIHQFTQTPIHESKNWIKKLAGQLDSMQRQISEKILAEISHRLEFLDQVGVGYLTLSRSAETLSGGELQRVRLASSIGSGLVGVCYILDEPSIGLHPRDTDRLVASIQSLKHQGNTLVVVEHDESMMRAADWLVDMGPGAGVHGGNVIATGTPQQIQRNADSITGSFLCGATQIEVPEQRRTIDDQRCLRLLGAKANNLKSVDVEIPLGFFVGVSGVSGSGKSSLMNDTLYPALAKKLGADISDAKQYRSLQGYESIEKLIPIDQAPIGRSPRSCPATHLGAMDEIRKVFAATRDAKQRGFKPGRFSFNSAAGQCPTCKGQGREKLEMQFLPDYFVVCESCGGNRFDLQTLQVRFKGRNVAQVLELSIDEATDFFENVPKLYRILSAARDVGLGYLALGQSSTTLSGGEAQRLKLATELARPTSGSTFYQLDEPTTGLHFQDVQRLLRVLQRLVDAGNTVVVIEHDVDVLVACDWLIDVGPEGGDAGGEIVVTGSPETVASHPTSHTGKFLRQRLGMLHSLSSDE